MTRPTALDAVRPSTHTPSTSASDAATSSSSTAATPRAAGASSQAAGVRAVARSVGRMPTTFATGDASICPIDDQKRSCYGRAMGSASRRWALNLVIHAHGAELRDEVARGLPMIVKLVLETVELRPGDAELLADAVITDLDGTEARLGVATFTLDELAARYPNLGLGLVR